MISAPASVTTRLGVLYCWPFPSPPAAFCTPGVIVMKLSPCSELSVRWAMKPMTKSRFSLACFAHAAVYSGLKKLSAELISASKRSER